MRDKVEKIIEELRPTIQLDGGDISLVSVDEKKGIVTIKFQGACVGCPISPITLQAGITHTLKSRIPAVKEVVAVDEE